VPVHPLVKPCPAPSVRRLMGLVVFEIQAQVAFAALLVLSDVLAFQQQEALLHVTSEVRKALLDITSEVARRSAANQQVSGNSTCAVLTRAGKGTRRHVRCLCMFYIHASTYIQVS
jgi:hypothetical protein